MIQRNNIALLLIDIQEGFNDKFWGKRSNVQAEENIAKLLKTFRELSLPVYHVQHLSKNSKSPLRIGSPGVEIMNFAKPIFGERIFQKHVHSSFIGTNLEEVLRLNKIDMLVVCGIAVDHCVSTTTRMAANLGFEVIVAGDATIAFERRGFDNVVFDASLVHSVTLASLHGEFATVQDTISIISKL